MKKTSLLFLLYIIFLSVSALDVHAGYNYTPLGEVIESAEALRVRSVIDSSNLTDVSGMKTDISFGALVDVFGFGDRVFVVDNSNSRVIVLDQNFRYLSYFGNTEGEGKLNKPQGIFVTDDWIYVADPGNFRIAIYNHNYEFVKEITTPDDPTFKQSPDDKDGYDFKPLRIAADRNGRVYAIADQIFEGVIDFNPDGTFSRYIGANTVTLSLWDAFWLNFTSAKQRKSQGYRLTSPFIGLNIDNKGYLYTLSTPEEGEKVIKKLNYKGLDVLTRNGYVPPSGDVWTITGDADVPVGPSQLIDIDINDFGTYSVLDKTRGRIFTYDFEGNLLYIGGQMGISGEGGQHRRSLFSTPSALCYYKDLILVTDSLNQNLVVMEYTEFASLVNEATENYYYGDYQKAGEIWNEVLSVNTNYFLAYAGIGKAQLREGNYREAMNNLKLGYDDYNYSEAYQKYRYARLTNIFPYVLGFAIAGAVFLFTRSIIRSVRAEREDENNE